MRLNNDCIRDILLCIEEKTDTINPYISREDIVKDLECKYDENTVKYHFRMLSGSKFIDTNNRDVNSFTCLTWEGHEYLDNIRDEGIWRTVQTKIKPVGSVAVGIIANLAEAAIKEKLGLS